MAEEASDLLGELANPERLMVVALLHEMGEMNVTEMVNTLGVNRVSLSRQLARLREQDMVTTRRKHNHVYYQINHPQASKLIKILGVLLKPKSPVANEPSSG